MNGLHKEDQQNLFLSVSVCTYMCCACVFMCTWLICCLHVMPVTGAITPGPSQLPAAEAVPVGRRHQLDMADGGDTLQSWSDETAKQNLSTLCLCAPRYVSSLSCADGEDMRRASLTLKANECEFKGCLSDGPPCVCNHFSRSRCVESFV